MKASLLTLVPLLPMIYVADHFTETSGEYWGLIIAIIAYGAAMRVIGMAESWINS